MIRQPDLVDQVRRYNASVDEDLLNRAYVFAMHAHGGQTRASGEPYMNHPVEVAAILTDLRLDDATIATALLHDTIEDTDATYATLAELFSEEIAELVDGVTKLSKLKLVSKETEQAENLRKLLMAMAKDPRVLLVKMADRLHNMRTIHHLRPEKRLRIARETMEIFAPLAGRMGMQHMREELEDLAFGVLNPEIRLSLMRRFVHLKRRTGESAAQSIAEALGDLLARGGVSAQVMGRDKRPYSIWRKMQEKGAAFEQLSDIVGFRVIVEDEAACYAALGVIHQGLVAVPGRFKDYISAPKANGYRSLHTTVVGRAPPGSDRAVAEVWAALKGARIEVQIRTREMHEVAEAGVAAHWAYRDGAPSANRFAVDPFTWLRTLVERTDRPDADRLEDPAEFLEDARLEISFDQVFCFTPKGRVVGLPSGATALDFAYAIHTDVGSSAVGAKVDGRRAPLWGALRNGQTVEILQSESQTPSPVWMNMVRTGRARAAIRRSLRETARREHAEIGEKLVRQRFARVGGAYTDKAVAIAAEALGFASGDLLLADVGAGRTMLRKVVDAVYPDLARAAEANGEEETPAEQRWRVRAKATVVRAAAAGSAPGSNGLDRAADDEAALELPPAACCAPLPGERVVAAQQGEFGYQIHAIDCEVLASLEDSADSWLDVRWSPDAADQADNPTEVEVLLANEPGALGRICTLIGASGANIDDLSFLDRRPDFFRLRAALAVRDIGHLSRVLISLNAQTAVTSATRVRPGPPRAPDDAPTD